MKVYLQKLLDLIRTILAVIELADGGFRITKAHNEYLGSDMYRFWWKEKMLPQHGDITHIGPGVWSSMLNGSARRLDILNFREWENGLQSYLKSKHVDVEYFPEDD